jgi:hypothetical protein
MAFQKKTPLAPFKTAVSHFPEKITAKAKCYFFRKMAHGRLTDQYSSAFSYVRKIEHWRANVP